MIITPDADLIATAQEFVLAHPKRVISKLEWHGQIVWLKRRPFQKKTYWHAVQGLFARLLGLPIFSNTATAGGAESLRDEAARLRWFDERGLSVPRVLAVTDDFLLTSDAGVQLQSYLSTLNCSNTIQAHLFRAIAAIQRMHQAGLCHGRPALKDMTLQNDIISLIDLEENPLGQMTLAQAQARDVWLFLNSAARFCQDDPQVLTRLFHTYYPQMNADSRLALQNMVRHLKPLRWVLDRRFITAMGRDIRCAIHANKILETYFFNLPRLAPDQ